MSKTTTQYVCNSCGDTFSKWAGRCYSCSEWNTLVVFRESKTSSMVGKSGLELKTTQLSDIAPSARKSRFTSKIEPVDDVLGGGVVPGSLVLVAGEPGVGKSTLMLQLASALAKEKDSANVLYVSGEESLAQVKLRADRLKLGKNSLSLASSTSTDDIVATIERNKPDVVVVDSIQTVSSAEVAAAAGAISQITRSTQAFQQIAKTHNCAVILVGHVTKEGNIAGPKILEHIVDVVLYMEGEKYGGLKVLRAVKNRFGSTNEVGIFEMENSGLSAVANPSAMLLAERQVSDGSVVLATMEGTRSLLVEVQALVSRTPYGYPKRTASGIDINRLNLLIAVLNQRTKLNLSESDVFVNIVGGMRIQEPAADLAVCMAIASAAKGMKLKHDAVVFGEVGLSGEIRHVSDIDKRIKEAEKLGFSQTIGPEAKKVGKSHMPVKSLREALNKHLER